MMRLLQVGVSIAAVALGLHFLPWYSLRDIVRIDLASFAAALALALISIAVTGLRWIYIVRRLTTALAREHWRIYLLGNLLQQLHAGEHRWRCLSYRRLAPLD